MTVTPRTFPATLNVPLGPAPLAPPWSHPVFLSGKLSKFTLPHPKPGGLSCCGVAADSKGQTLAPSHAFSPSQTLSLSLQGKMGLCPSVPTTLGTWDIYGCVLDECYSVITGEPREIPGDTTADPCLTETPSLDSWLWGASSCPPFAFLYQLLPSLLGQPIS